MEKFAAKASSAPERQNSAPSDTQDTEMTGKSNSEIVRETSNTTVSMDTDSNSVSQSDSRAEIKGSQSEPMEIDDTKLVTSSSEPVQAKDSAKRKREGSASDGGQMSTSRGQASAVAGIEISPPGSNEDLPPALRGVGAVKGHC